MHAKHLGAVLAMLVWLLVVACSGPPAALPQSGAGHAPPAPPPGPMPPPPSVQAIAGEQLHRLEAELSREHARLPHFPGAYELRHEPTGGLDWGRRILQVEVTAYYRSGPSRPLDWLMGPAHPLADVLDWYASALPGQGWSVRRAQDERLGAWLAFERGSAGGTVGPENFRSPEHSPRRADEFVVNLVLPPAPLAADAAGWSNEDHELTGRPGSTRDALPPYRAAGSLRHRLEAWPRPRPGASGTGQGGELMAQQQVPRARGPGASALRRGRS